MAAVFIVPYGAAVFGNIFSASESAKAFERLFDPLLLKTVGFTIAQAAGSTFLSLIVGLPGAYFYSKQNTSLAKVLRSLSALPFVLPPILVVLGFVLFFGNAGWMNRFFTCLSADKEPVLRVLYRPSAIIIAHAFYNFPIVVRVVGDALIKARRYIPVSAALGASPTKTLFSVEAPLCAPAIASASLLIFLYCFTSFAIVLTLGGGPGASTLAVEIYRAARIELNFNNASALAFSETAIIILIFLLYRFTEFRLRIHDSDNSTTSFCIPYRASLKSSSPIKNRIGPIIYGVFLLIFVAGPLLSIALESFLKSGTNSHGFSLMWWRSLAKSAGTSAVGSLILAATSASLCCLIAVLALLSRPRHGKHLSLLGNINAFICSAPLMSSGIVLSYGFIRLYGSITVRSFWAVSLVHAVTALPFAYRTLAVAYDSLSSSLFDASTTLSANPIKTSFFVILPALANSLRSAWAFSAAISLGDLNAVLMLGLEGWDTLPLLIYRSVGAYRFGSACAAGCLLLIVCFLFFRFSDIGNKRRGSYYGIND